MAVPESSNVRLSAQGLWKLFGPNPRKVLREPWVADASRKEVQERAGHVVAVKDATFEVKAGEVFVVMGLSGSGKSTLVRCLIRLVEPTAGAIFVDGEDIIGYNNKQLTHLRRSKMGMVFQHYGLLPHRKVIDNVAFGLEIQGVNKAGRYKKANEVLARVGLDNWANAYPDELSGGMQQRVGLARALALDPAILLMDEPFSGLDPLIRREMQDELISLQSQLNKTIIFITHDLNEALKLGSRIAIMRDGAFIQVGTPEEIVTLPADEYVSEFVRDVSRAKVLTAASIMQQPEGVAYEWQGPRVALHLMQSTDANYAFVVGKENLLRGLVTLEQAAQAVQEGISSLDAVSRSSDYPVVSPEILVQDLVHLVARYDHAIPVVDPSGHLLGEVHRAAVLNTIAIVPRSAGGALAARQPVNVSSPETFPV